KGQQPRTALPNASVSPFGIPFDKILRQIAHSSLCSSHTICRKISLVVSPSSAHVRRRRQILYFFDSLQGASLPNTETRLCCSHRLLPGCLLEKLFCGGYTAAKRGGRAYTRSCTKRMNASRSSAVSTLTTYIWLPMS